MPVLFCERQGREGGEASGVAVGLREGMVTRRTIEKKSRKRFNVYRREGSILVFGRHQIDGTLVPISFPGGFGGRLPVCVP